MSLKLLSDINNGDKHIFNISTSEAKEVLTMLSSDTVVSLSKLNEPALGKFEHDVCPRWLKSKPDDNCWIIMLEGGDTHSDISLTVDFNIVFGAEKFNLTNPRFKILLKCFKYWIMSVLDLRLASGVERAPRTRVEPLRRLLSLLDFILLNADKLGLAKIGFKCINSDLIKDFTATQARSTNHVYGVHKKLRRLADDIELYVSDEDVDTSNLRFKYFDVNESLIENDYLITASQQLKLMAYFYKNNCYIESSGKLSGQRVTKLLYKNIILRGDGVRLIYPDELSVDDGGRYLKEFASMAVKSENRNSKIISSVLKVLGGLALLVNDWNNSPKFDDEFFEELTSKSLSRYVIHQNESRFRTLPPAIVFESMKNGFEFVFDNIEHIYCSMKIFIEHAPKERIVVTVDGKKTTTTVLKNFKNDELPALLDIKTKAFGVDVHSISCSMSERFELLRENKGLNESYCILQGSLKVIVGALMARRQGELIDLLHKGNIFPNKDPSINKDTDYFLYFYNRKSGLSGRSSKRERIKRPIPHSVANFIWKTEQFNDAVLNIYKEQGYGSLINEKELTLFNQMHLKKPIFNKKNHSKYNRDLDIFCDYFETPIEILKGVEHRYYIRQHQLRRFFALMFFWSKGFDGLDTLRHFLGHTDMSHLYNYITEGTTGKVLNGVKASVLANKYAQKNIKNYGALLSLIKQLYGSEDAELLTAEDAFNDYENAKRSQPSMDTLNNELNTEHIILNLLESNIIKLEPEFFTVESKDGSQTQDFTLVLKIIED